jgi:hypothetical protein
MSNTPNDIDHYKSLKILLDQEIYEVGKMYEQQLADNPNDHNACRKLRIQFDGVWNKLQEVKVKIKKLESA